MKKLSILLGLLVLSPLVLTSCRFRRRVDSTPISTPSSTINPTTNPIVPTTPTITTPTPTTPTTPVITTPTPITPTPTPIITTPTPTTPTPTPIEGKINYEVKEDGKSDNLLSIATPVIHNFKVTTTTSSYFNPYAICKMSFVFKTESQTLAKYIKIQGKVKYDDNSYYALTPSLNSTEITRYQGQLELVDGYYIVETELTSFINVGDTDISIEVAIDSSITPDENLSLGRVTYTVESIVGGTSFVYPTIGADLEGDLVNMVPDIKATGLSYIWVADKNYTSLTYRCSYNGISEANSHTDSFTKGDMIVWDGTTASSSIVRLN